jgi:hypothetical protein
MAQNNSDMRFNYFFLLSDAVTDCGIYRGMTAHFGDKCMNWRKVLWLDEVLMVPLVGGHRLACEEIKA